MTTYSIGDVARISGLKPSALRYYESEGILAPTHRINGQRRYDDAALTTLKVIAMAQEAGFTIAEIATLLTGFSADTPASIRWQTLANQKLSEVDALIARAQTMRQVLIESLACSCLTLESCTVIGWQHSTDSLSNPSDRSIPADSAHGNDRSPL